MFSRSTCRRANLGTRIFLFVVTHLCPKTEATTGKDKKEKNSGHYKDFIVIHRVSASNVSRRKMRFLVSYLEYQKRFFLLYFILFYYLRLHNIKLIHSIMQVIKQSNKEKVAGIPQQREPVTAGPEN